MKRQFRLFLLFLSVTMAAAGCSVAPTKAYPVKKQYVIDVTRPEGNVGNQALVGVKVRRFRIAAAFARNTLTYRTKEVVYETDFYNEFLTSPENLITNEVTEWLNDSGEFMLVAGLESWASTSYVLEGNITALYGDFANPDEPNAVLEIQIFLIDDAADVSAVVFQKTYRKTTALADKSAVSVVHGFNICLAEFLTDLEADLKTSLQ